MSRDDLAILRPCGAVLIGGEPVFPCSVCDDAATCEGGECPVFAPDPDMVPTYAARDDPCDFGA